MRGSELGDREMAMPWREGTLSTERRNEEKKRGAEFAKEETLSDHGTGGQKIHKRATGVSLFVCCLFCFVLLFFKQHLELKLRFWKGVTFSGAELWLPGEERNGPRVHSMV